MTRSHLAIYSVVALGIIVTIGSRTRTGPFLTPTELEHRLTAYAKQGRLAQYDLPSFLVGNERVETLYIRACVEQARKKYGRNVSGFAINPSTFDPSLVNLIFVRDDPEHTFRDFRGNCAFTGYKNIIVCDLVFLHEITGTTERDLELESRNPSGRPHPLLKGASAGIALWVIGHEIGHLAHGHRLRHFLFRDEAPRNLIRNPDGRPVGNSYIAEQEADSFAFEVFKDRTPELGNTLTLAVLQVMSGFANAQHGRQGEGYDEFFGITNHHYRPEITSETHPPTSLRAATIAKYITEGLRPEQQNQVFRENDDGSQ